MLESGSSGSVRGASSNGRPYREPRSRAVIDRRMENAAEGRKARPMGRLGKDRSPGDSCRSIESAKEASVPRRSRR